MRLDSNLDMDFGRKVATVGSFDGVHRGHRMLLGRVVDFAKQYNLKSVALTFNPHPRQVIDSSKNNTVLLLNTLEERIALLKQTGVDDVKVLTFDKELSMTSASDFVRDILIEKLKAKYLLVGQDHHFGKERSGDVKHLIDFSSKNDLQVEVLKLKMTDRKISSSAIRKALLSGDLYSANEMLGYQYNISGNVIGGNQLGRTISFPTANIEIPKHKLLPKEGVYRVKVKIENEKIEHIGMLYIGKRTILHKVDNAIHVEVHIFNFARNIYGRKIKLALTHYIRKYIKFDNIERLSEQLNSDRQTILSLT